MIAAIFLAKVRRAIVGFLTPSEDAALVSTEHGAPDYIPMLENGIDLLSRGDVPEPRSLVIAPG